jgi:hypothetical protein
LQKGFLPLPKSVTPANIEANLHIFDFELSEEDILRLDGVGGRGRLGLDVLLWPHGALLAAPQVILKGSGISTKRTHTATLHPKQNTPPVGGVL